MPLKKFFAVTTTSIYEVICDGKSLAPIVRKVALRGSSAVIVGGTLKDGTMLSVGKNLVMFTPEGHSWLSPMTSFERDLDKVPLQWQGGHSSYVVSLFLKKTDAEKCLAADSEKVCDPRWLEQTKEVLRAIGDDHPQISMPSSPNLWLMSPDSWKK
ncbi:MAG: hypothetical protein Q8L24_00760 [bacterium]|nr:hypothetical protein [bacterium]